MHVRRSGTGRRDLAGTVFNLKMNGKRPLATGGFTMLAIADKNNTVVARSMVKCSNQDPFNKTIGRNIAIGRALKTNPHLLA
jgi:hypothetical protein